LDRCSSSHYSPFRPRRGAAEIALAESPRSNWLSISRDAGAAADILLATIITTVRAAGREEGRQAASAEAAAAAGQLQELLRQPEGVGADGRIIPPTMIADRLFSERLAYHSSWNQFICLCR